MFTFNEDGTISGMKTVQPKSPIGGMQTSPKSNGKKSKNDSKFGKISSKMSVSAMSVGGESKVAFSDADYLPDAGQ